MSGHITVGLSGESDWRDLGETVAQVAVGLDAAVRLVHVGEREPARDTERWLASVRSWYRARGVQRVDAHWVEGDAEKVLVRAAEDPGALMLALGATDLRTRRRGTVGGTTVHVLRKSQIPVLVVPWGAPTRPRRLTSLVYPADFSQRCERGLAQAGRLAKSLDADLHLVHVYQPLAGIRLWLDDADSGPHTPYADDEELAALRDRLEDVTVPHAPRVHRQVVLHRSHALAIVEHAAALETDLIVMPSHGRGAIGSLLLGSVTENVLRLADRPVLVLKPLLPVAGRSAPGPALFE